MKTENKLKSAETYASPAIKTVKLSPRAHYLQQISNPGNRWIDGGAGMYGDEEINDNGSY